MSLIVFNENNQRKMFGSIMLTIMDEWLSIKYNRYNIYVTLNHDIPNLINVRKYFRSLYFNDYTGENINDQFLIQPIIHGIDKENYITKSTNTIILRSTIPIYIATCLFFWLYPSNHNKDKDQHLQNKDKEREDV